MGVRETSLLGVLRGVAAAIFGVLSLSCGAVADEGKPSTIVVYQHLKLSFEPRDVFFFVDLGAQGKIDRLRGLLVPSGETPAAGTELPWLSGAEIQVPPGLREVVFSVLVTGNSGGYAFTPSVHWDLAQEPTPALSYEDLGDVVIKRKDELKSWKTQYDAQQASLRRLEADSEVVSRAERVHRIEDQLTRLRAEVAATDQDMERLKDFLKLVRAEDNPRNFAPREIELTKQLGELARAAKEVESGEIGRKSRGESDLQDKLRIVEETRSENLEALQRRLDELRRHRMRIEAERGPVNTNDVNQMP